MSEKYTPSPTAYTRVYLAMCLRHSAQILLCRTSDTLVTLDEIAFGDRNDCN